VKVLVAYESRGGRTRRAATAIADACRAEGHDVALLPLAQVGRSEVDQCDVAALGSWVEGFILFGVKPGPGRHPLARPGAAAGRQAGGCVRHLCREPEGQPRCAAPRG
jgi:hypothetical protein